MATPEKGGNIFRSAVKTEAPSVPKTVPERRIPADSPEPGKHTKEKTPSSKKALIAQLAGSLLALAGIAGPAVGHHINYESKITPPAVGRDLASVPGFYWNLGKGVVDRLFNNKQLLHEGSLAPQPGEPVSWWQELSTEEIQRLAEVPGINMIGESYLFTVNSILQEKAKQAGYELIYQGDPNDTTGRTVVGKDRQLTDAFDDLGFGILGNQARGVFEKWIPDPNDQEQQNGVFAQFKDPITQKSFLVKVDLRTFDPNRFSGGVIDIPTFLYVDDLENGPEAIQKGSAVAGFELSSEMLPDPTDLQSEKFKAPKNHIDMTFYELTRRRGLSLDEIAQPGDFIIIKSDTVVSKDKQGIVKAGAFIIRRFGGMEQWQSEIN